MACKIGQLPRYGNQRTCYTLQTALAIAYLAKQMERGSLRVS